jgi:drug/metabolite transporter (DMT)-like permease
MTAHPKSKPSTSLFLLILLGTIWGTGYSIARFAMTNDVPPLGYSFWQSLGPAIIIGTLAILRTRTLTFSASRVRFYLVTGLTGIVIPNTTMYFAAPHLPAGILAMVVNTVPIIAYPMALLAGLEKFNWERMAGIFLALAGIMLIIIPKSSLASASMTPWVLSTLLTPLSFAFCSIYIARFRPADSDSLTLSAGMLIFSSLLLTPLVFATDSLYLFHLPLTAPDGVILLEIVLSSLGYVLFFQLIKVAGPVYYSLVDTIVVITGIFWGRMIFDERLNTWTFAAVILIVLALLLVTRHQRKITTR